MNSEEYYQSTFFRIRYESYFLRTEKYGFGLIMPLEKYGSLAACLSSSRIMYFACRSEASFNAESWESLKLFISRYISIWDRKEPDNFI